MYQNIGRAKYQQYQNQNTATVPVPNTATRGPFLESPGNFLGPKPEFGIKTRRVVACVLAHKRVYFVSLTVTFIILLSKIINCRS